MEREVAKSKKKSAVTPQKAALRSAPSPKLKRTKQPRARLAVDAVRASRDGHEFHEAWVARKSLGLLMPGSELVGIAVEGFANEDQRGVSKEGNEIADAVMYFGGRPNLQHAKRAVVVQVKYSKAAEHKPFRATDAKKTIGALLKSEWVMRRGG